MIKIIKNCFWRFGTTKIQKKINQIVVDNKRTFKDILLGKPAYNEVMFYEIKKYNDTGTLLKSILSRIN